MKERNSQHKIYINIKSTGEYKMLKKATDFPSNLNSAVIKKLLKDEKNFMPFARYAWPGRFRPFQHQKETAKFLVTHKQAIVLNDIGTGKTMSALWAAHFLLASGRISKVLILSPLSTLRHVWANEIEKNFPDRSAVVLHGSAEKRRRLLKEEHDFYIINHDGMGVIKDRCEGMFDLLIVDESSVYKNKSSRRFKELFAWIYGHRNPIGVWLMTGTPTPNAPTDAWTQARLIGNPDVPRAFTAFRRDVMEQVNHYKWRPKNDANEKALMILKPSIRFVRDECLDLPDTVVLEREAKMSHNQMVAFNEMKNDFLIEVEGQEIIARNEGVKLSKLVQICCGFSYNTKGNAVTIGAKDRLRVLSECLEHAGGKSLIFCPLKAAIDMIDQHLEPSRKVGVVNSETKPEDRAHIFEAFQNSGNIDIIIAHPATMSHGLTLTAASSIIWYAPIHSNEQYTQANGRVERFGKREKSFVFHIYGHPIERRMYSALRNKQKMQGILLKMLANDRG